MLRVDSLFEGNAVKINEGIDNEIDTQATV
jgi:hypothetical protein